MANPRWTGFTHTAKAQMQCLDDLPIPSKTSLNSKTFNARLTRSLIPARSCGAVRKISNCRSKTRARCCYITYRSGCSKRSQSGVRRKVGNVPTISVPGFDQYQALTGGSFRATERFSSWRLHKAVVESAASQPYCCRWRRSALRRVRSGSRQSIAWPNGL